MGDRERCRYRYEDLLSEINLAALIISPLVAAPRFLCCYDTRQYILRHLPGEVMFCIHCGSANPEDASFCSLCGKAIGAPANPPPPAKAPQQALTSAEKSFGNATGEALPPITLPAQPTPPPQAQYLAATTGKGKPVLWILAGFTACLLIVIAMALGSRWNQNSSGPAPARDNVVPDPAPTAAPATYTPPPEGPAADSTP